MRPLTSLLAALLCLSTTLTPAAAQTAPPSISVLAGLGNTFGGLGVSGEYMLAHGRAGVVAGAGYLPESDGYDDTWGAAAGMRLYSSIARHSGFAEAGVMPIAISLGPTGQHNHYGPALSIGYRYLANRGFTAIIGIGAGWTSAGGVDAVGNLGFGITWR